MTPLQPVLARSSPRLATTRPHPPQPGTASPIQPPRPLRQINYPTTTGRPIPNHGGHSLSKRPYHSPIPKHRVARGDYQDVPRATRRATPVPGGTRASHNVQPILTEIKTDREDITQPAQGPATHPTEVGKLGGEGSHTMVATTGAGEELKQVIEEGKHMSPEGVCNRQQQPVTTAAQHMSQRRARQPIATHHPRQPRRPHQGA